VLRRPLEPESSEWAFLFDVGAEQGVRTREQLLKELKGRRPSSLPVISPARSLAARCPRRFVGRALNVSVPLCGRRG
jgi:hypothetical protein